MLKNEAERAFCSVLTERLPERSASERAANPRQCSRSDRTTPQNEAPLAFCVLPLLPPRGRGRTERAERVGDAIDLRRPLARLIRHVGELREYTEAEIAALIAEAAALPAAGQADLIAHFTAELAVWRAACGQPGSEP